MDLTIYSLEDLLLAAIKSEVDSKAVYLQLADNVNNAFLRDKLKFIADEEQRHREYLESVYKMNMKSVPTLPESSPVPLPEVRVQSGMVVASEIMIQAMKAEEAASEFYTFLANNHEWDDETKNTLAYLASMEMGHYKLLEIEREQLADQEEFEFGWSMMHAGP